MRSELIQVVQSDTPGAMTQLSEAVQKGDAPGRRETAHRLRGLLSTSSAAAAEAAARLETIGANGRLDDAVTIHDGLAEMVRRLGRPLDGLSIEPLRHQAGGGERV